VHRAQLRWEAHVPVNLFHAALSALQNRQICAAAWPGAPGARPPAARPAVPRRCAERPRREEPAALQTAPVAC